MVKSKRGVNVDNIGFLCPIDSPSVSDQVALWSSQYQRNGRATISSILALYTSSIPISGSKVQYEQPSASGFSLLVNPLTATNAKVNTWLLIRPLSDYATGTIILPSIANLSDQMEVLITSTRAVTTLTVDGNSLVVNGAPSTMAANDRFRFKYDLTTNQWYRIV